MVVRPSSLDQFKEAINNLLKPKAKKWLYLLKVLTEQEKTL
jgi:hypothetical protein